MTLDLYKRTGVLAFDPRAFTELFALVNAPRVNARCGRVEVVEVFGPLDGPGTTCWDSYSAIRARMQLACESDAQAIVLRVNSPGGDVAGCVECAHALRDLAAVARKPLYAYVDAKACSAAYVLASAASDISVASCALLGSVGVVSRRDDVTAANAMRGLTVSYITSGARKLDGSPDVPMSADEQAAQQAIVDTTARVLFQTVAELRPGLTVDQLAAMQAGIFVGDSAVQSGLADQVESFDSLLTRIELGGTQMGSPYEKALAALQETAKGKDANAVAAKRALAALTGAADGGDDDDKQSDDAPPAKDDQASGGDAPMDDDKKKDPPPAQSATPAAPAQASATDIALQALATVHTMQAERAAEKAAAERATLIASRPDFSAELKAILQTADLATVRKTVETLPKAAVTNTAPLSAVSGTRGETQGSAADQVGSTHTRDMDRQMGLVSTSLGVERRGSTLVFGLQEKVNKPADPGAAGGAN